MVIKEEAGVEASSSGTKRKRPKQKTLILVSAVLATRRETMNKSGYSESESESSTKPNTNKPPFKPAKDDTKPVLQDPILRSDPIETEEAVLRLPPFKIPK